MTGEGGGLGRKIAKGLSEFGARLVIADLDLSAAEATAQAIKGAGGKAWALQVDVTSPSSAQALADAAATQEGRIARSDRARTEG